MIHVTIFGGHEGRLQEDKWLYFTLFGACELVRPTLARRILAARQAGQERPASPRKPVMLTIFGATEIKCPTLAEEFIDLREMMSSGLLTMEDWDRSVATLSQFDAGIISLTLFAGLDEAALPEEDDEIEALAVQQHLGNISQSATQVLQFGIGRAGTERASTLRRALYNAA